jgi:HlyD family secretion protein
VQWKRWLGFGTALSIVVLLVVYGFRPEPVLVEITEVKRGPLQLTVEEEGKTRVKDRYVVSAAVAGFARRVKLEVGDRVTQGQLLLSLEPLRPNVLDPRSRAEAAARVAAAEAVLNAAEERVRAATADAGYWEGQLGRTQMLYQSGDVSKEAFDRAVSETARVEASRRSAEHAVEEARSNLEAARAALRYSAASMPRITGELVAIRAPSSGRVLKVVHKSEGVVNPGDPLLEVANARSLEIEVEVLSADAVRIAPGTRVLLERWGGNAPLEGRVRLGEPVAFTKISALGVEEQRVLVIVDLTSPPELWERLGDGYRVEARFILWEGQDVLQVPSSALFRHGHGWAVFTMQDGVARIRPVETDHRNGLAAELVSGLSVGEKVITHPDNSIKDGTPVKARG